MTIRWIRSLLGVHSVVQDLASIECLAEVAVLRKRSFAANQSIVLSIFTHDLSPLSDSEADLCGRR